MEIAPAYTRDQSIGLGHTCFARFRLEMLCLIASIYMLRILRFLLTLSLSISVSAQYCEKPQASNLNSLFIQDCITFHQVILLVGTPHKPFRFLIDTGSLITWLPTTSCMCGSGVNPQTSVTSKVTTVTHDIKYTDGDAVYGFQGTQSFSMEGTQLTNVETLMVFVTRKEAPKTGNSGILALGYSVDNLLDVAWQKGTISSSVFALKFGQQEGESRIYFDKLPRILLEGNVYSPVVTSQELWVVKCYGITVNGRDYSSSTYQNAVIDSGTTITCLNHDLYRELATSTFQGCIQDSTMGFLCPSQIKLPKIQIYLEGNIVYLNPEHYSELVGSKVQVYLASSNRIILGSSFFKNYVVTFDKHNKRVGFYGQNTRLSKIGSNLLKYSTYAVLALLSLVLILVLTSVACHICNREAPPPIFMYP